MTGAHQILVAAFVAQLAVLPGEKVQFIIAALSTRYRPVVVVSAAGTAFAAWTALEVAFGGLLQRILPGPSSTGSRRGSSSSSGSPFSRPTLGS